MNLSGSSKIHRSATTAGPSDAHATKTAEGAGKRKAEASVQQDTRFPDKRRNTSSDDAGPRTRMTRSALAARRKPLDELSSNATVLVGGGPRTSNTIRAESQFLQEHLAEFEELKSLGANYSGTLQTLIVERQSGEYLARGNAWGPNQGVRHSGGTANTSTESSNRQVMGNFLVANRESLAADFERENNVLAGAVLDTAFRAGHVKEGDDYAMYRAAATRSALGELEQLTLKDAISKAQEIFPDYQVTIVTEASAESLDISEPRKPKLKIIDTTTKLELATVQAGLVRLNTGTTLGIQVKTPAVAKHTFQRSLDPEAVGDFLRAKGVLDGDDMLKPGTKLALAGTNLSFYDELTAVVKHTKLLVKDPSSELGYKVDPDVAKLYPGLLTAVSFSAGKWIGPRHSHSSEWSQKTELLGTPAELHAAFLHGDGQEVLKGWAKVIDASVARSQGMTPVQANRVGLSTEDLLKAQRADTTKHLDALNKSAGLTGQERREAFNESTHTPDGAMRQARLGTILGAPSRNPAAAAEELDNAAPLTSKGRTGYLKERANLSGVTLPGSASAENNRALVSKHTDFIQSVIASPVVVHSVASELWDLGVLGHVPASFDDFKPNADGTGLKLAGRDGSDNAFAAFIAAPRLQREGEPVLESLAGQVKPAHPDVPDLPQVGAQRAIIAADGSRTSVQDYGYNGTGAKVGGNLKGAFAFEVNNRDSSVADGPTMATMRMAAAHLTAAGFDDGQALIDQLFAKHLPSDEAYAAEVAKFEPEFNSLMKKATLMGPIAHGAGNDGAAYAAYATASETGSSVKTRAALMDGLIPTAANQALPTPPNAARRWEAISQISDAAGTEPKFQPASKADYFARFVDTPKHICDAVYAEAFEMAKAKLRSAAAAAEMVG